MMIDWSGRGIPAAFDVSDELEAIMIDWSCKGIPVAFRAAHEVDELCVDWSGAGVPHAVVMKLAIHQHSFQNWMHGDKIDAKMNTKTTAKKIEKTRAKDRKSESMDSETLIIDWSAAGLPYQ